jgi:hypothetical protein
MRAQRRHANHDQVAKAQFMAHPLYQFALLLFHVAPY